jgi:hypothetical protein
MCKQQGYFSIKFRKNIIHQSGSEHMLGSLAEKQAWRVFACLVWLAGSGGRWVGGGVGQNFPVHSLAFE